MAITNEFHEGQRVKVKRHKCGIDTIGPFETVIDWIEDDGIAEVIDPEGRDWMVRLSHLEPIEGHR